MNDQQRLARALDKIEARKKRLRERGVSEPSKFGYIMRDLAAPAFRGAVLDVDRAMVSSCRNNHLLDYQSTEC